MKNNVLNIFKLIFEKVKKYIHICAKGQYIMADNGEAGANRQKDKLNKISQLYLNFINEKKTSAY